MPRATNVIGRQRPDEDEYDFDSSRQPGLAVEWRDVTGNTFSVTAKTSSSTGYIPAITSLSLRHRSARLD